MKEKSSLSRVMKAKLVTGKSFNNSGKSTNNETRKCVRPAAEEDSFQKRPCVENDALEELTEVDENDSVPFVVSDTPESIVRNRRPNTPGNILSMIRSRVV